MERGYLLMMRSTPSMVCGNRYSCADVHGVVGHIKKSIHGVIRDSSSVRNS